MDSHKCNDDWISLDNHVHNILNKVMYLKPTVVHWQFARYFSGWVLTHCLKLFVEELPSFYNSWELLSITDSVDLSTSAQPFMYKWVLQD